MEYRLSVTFADLGYSLDLPDRLLTFLLEAMPESGPVIDQDTATGELTVVVAFESARPADEAGRFTTRLEAALARVGARQAPTLLGVHLAAVEDEDEVLSCAKDALQPV